MVSSPIGLAQKSYAAKSCIQGLTNRIWGTSRFIVKFELVACCPLLNSSLIVDYVFFMAKDFQYSSMFYSTYSAVLVNHPP